MPLSRSHYGSRASDIAARAALLPAPGECTASVSRHRGEFGDYVFEQENSIGLAERAAPEHVRTFQLA